MREAYRARWRGDEYPAAPEPQPDQLFIRLYRERPADGFDEIEPERYVRAVPAAECEAVVHLSLVCEWRGAPFLVCAERDEDLLLEYTGGLAPVATRLGMQRAERGVYRKWVPRTEVRALREYAAMLSQ
jgi:hypothetical protein